MPRMHLDHLYRETHDWDASVDFWQRLGFAFSQRWGDEPHRAGRLENDDTVIVLAEITADRDPADAVFIAVDDIEAFAASTGTDVADTHWGTRMVTVTDPDGRSYRFEPGTET